MIHSDFHIHSEHSYDAKLPLEEIAKGAMACGFTRIGISDHLNYNDPPFLQNIYDSAAGVKALQEKYPFMILGVELTPIQKAQFDYIAKNGTREGYALTAGADRYGIELALTKQELMALGIRYAVGAAHWSIDTIGTEEAHGFEGTLREFYRQQMWLAEDARVTILGHPWYNGHGFWGEDLSVIPRSMQMELAAAVKENGKCVECNSGMLFNKNTGEKYRYQYAEMLREYFEMGIKVTYGSDSHRSYNNDRSLDGQPLAGHAHEAMAKYLAAAGFKDGDFYTLQDSDLW